MKPGEHEYKVMGLAPYAPARETERAVAALGKVFAMSEGKPSLFEWRRRGPLLSSSCSRRRSAFASTASPAAPSRCSRRRWCAGRAWRRRRYGGERLALGGGVFMNVKANMLIAGEGWLRRALRLSVLRRRVERGRRGLSRLSRSLRRSGHAPAPRPFGPAYLGPDVDDAEIEDVIRRRDIASRYRVSEHARDRGEDRRPARVRRRRRALRRADGVRGARARQPLDPGQPVGPPRGRRDQPDDQEPRLLDAVRADDPARARGGLSRSIRGGSPRRT